MNLKGSQGTVHGQSINIYFLCVWFQTDNLATLITPVKGLSMDGGQVKYVIVDA